MVPPVSVWYPYMFTPLASLLEVTALPFLLKSLQAAETGSCSNPIPRGLRSWVMKSKARPQYHGRNLKTFYSASCHRSEALLEIDKNGNKRGGKSWTMPPGSARMGVPAPHPSHPSDHQAGDWVCFPSSAFVCGSVAVADSSCSPQVSAFFRL